MFNRAGFNRQPFNRAAASGEDVSIKSALAERLDGYMNIGADYYITGRLNESLRSDLRLAAGMPIFFEAKEALAGALIATTGVEIEDALSESINGSVHFGADIYFLSQQLAENLGGVVHMGATIYVYGALSEALTGVVHLGANVYMRADMYEALNGYANARDIREQITAVLGDIPSGGIMVIDSDNFTMLLNNQNAIHWHNGDWITVERGTVNLTLSGIGSNSYTWEVFYYAKYL